MLCFVVCWAALFNPKSKHIHPHKSHYNTSERQFPLKLTTMAFLLLICTIPSIYSFVIYVMLLLLVGGVCLVLLSCTFNTSNHYIQKLE